MSTHRSFTGSGPFGRWGDWYHDAQVMAGEATGPLHAPPHTFQAKADVPGLDPLLIRDYPNFNTGDPRPVPLPDLQAAVHASGRRTTTCPT